MPHLHNAVIASHNVPGNPVRIVVRDAPNDGQVPTLPLDCRVATLLAMTRERLDAVRYGGAV
ncbi:hypothetical protein N9D63_06910 [Opitutales bacterium]|jgi:hypothetical protein|nr:hypothetical protein [Opitutales bacterium]